MNSFQILSTQFRFDGWMDMNILTPHGVLSIEFQLDDESINALSVLDFMRMDGENSIGNEGQLDDDRLKSLLLLVKILARSDYWSQVKPLEWFHKSHCFNKPISISPN